MCLAKKYRAECEDIRIDYLGWRISQYLGFCGGLLFKVTRFLFFLQCLTFLYAFADDIYDEYFPVFVLILTYFTGILFYSHLYFCCFMCYPFLYESMCLIWIWMECLARAGLLVLVPIFLRLDITEYVLLSATINDNVYSFNYPVCSFVYVLLFDSILLFWYFGMAVFRSRSKKLYDAEILLSEYKELALEEIEQKDMESSHSRLIVKSSLDENFHKSQSNSTIRIV